MLLASSQLAVGSNAKQHESCQQQLCQVQKGCRYLSTLTVCENTVVELPLLQAVVQSAITQWYYRLAAYCTIVAEHAATVQYSNVPDVILKNLSLLLLFVLRSPPLSVFCFPSRSLFFFPFCPSRYTKEALFPFPSVLYTIQWSTLVQRWCCPHCLTILLQV